MAPRIVAVAPAAEEESPKQIFDRFDANKDGVLSLEEFSKYVQELRDYENAVKGLPVGAGTDWNLEYGPHGGSNMLDLYRPANARGPLPLVLWIHGGGWLLGTKNDGFPGACLLAHGFAVASINYRLSGEARYPAQIEDCKAAVRFLRANAARYGLDPDHIGAWGESSGGHLAALLGTTGGVRELEGDGPNREESSRVQAVVDWYGPTDFLKVQEQTVLPGAVNALAQKSIYTRLLGGLITENTERAETANPVHYIAKDAAPFFIMHGDQDRTVPVGQSRILDAALRAAGVESTLIVIEGAGHGGGAFASAENLPRIMDFLDKHLKPKADGTR